MTVEVDHPRTFVIADGGSYPHHYAIYYERPSATGKSMDVFKALGAKMCNDVLEGNSIFLFVTDLVIHTVNDTCKERF